VIIDCNTKSLKMILFNLKNKKLSPINPKLFGAEKEIQSIVESNTEEIFDLRLVSRDKIPIIHNLIHHHFQLK